MLDARARKFAIVVVGRWDRFSRIQARQAVAIYRLHQYGVKVIAATEPIPDGPVGTLVRINYAFAAERDLCALRERACGGKKRCRSPIPAPWRAADCAAAHRGVSSRSSRPHAAGTPGARSRQRRETWRVDTSRGITQVEQALLSALSLRPVHILARCIAIWRRSRRRESTKINDNRYPSVWSWRLTSAVTQGDHVERVGRLLPARATCGAVPLALLAQEEV
jgi:hypothetical protein